MLPWSCASAHGAAQGAWVHAFTNLRALMMLMRCVYHSWPRSQQQAAAWLDTAVIRLWLVHGSQLPAGQLGHMVNHRMEKLTCRHANDCLNPMASCSACSPPQFLLVAWRHHVEHAFYGQLVAEGALCGSGIILAAACSILSLLVDSGRAPGIQHCWSSKCWFHWSVTRRPASASIRIAVAQITVRSRVSGAPKLQC